LTFGKPTKRPAVFEDNTATHTSKFEERKKSTVRHSVPDLRTPTSIAIGGEARRVVRVVFWRVSVAISFHVSARRIVNEGVHRANGIGCKRNPVVVRRMDIVEGVEGRFHMSGRGLVAVCRQKGVGCDEVGASRIGEPTETTN
jgi:hypothetical protein